MNIYPSFTNDIKIEGDSVTKTFTSWGSVKTAMISSVYMIKYSGSRERYEREKNALQALWEKAILVPQIIGYNDREKNIVTKKIDNDNLKYRLRNPDTPLDNRLEDFTKYLKVLKAIHEAGYAHGDPAPQNFGFCADGLYSFDFEHDTKFHNIKGKQNADMSCALMCSVGYLSDVLEKGEIDPVLETMEKTYGSTPEPVSTPFMFAEFHLPNRTNRPDLYKAIFKTK